MGCARKGFRASRIITRTVASAPAHTPPSAAAGPPPTASLANVAARAPSHGCRRLVARWLGLGYGRHVVDAGCGGRHAVGGTQAVAALAGPPCHGGQGAGAVPVPEQDRARACDACVRGRARECMRPAAACWLCSSQPLLAASVSAGTLLQPALRAQGAGGPVRAHRPGAPLAAAPVRTAAHSLRTRAPDVQPHMPCVLVSAPGDSTAAASRHAPACAQLPAATPRQCAACPHAHVPACTCQQQRQCCHMPACPHARMPAAASSWPSCTTTPRWWTHARAAPLWPSSSRASRHVRVAVQGRACVRVAVQGRAALHCMSPSHASRSRALSHGSALQCVWGRRACGGGRGGRVRMQGPGRGQCCLRACLTWPCCVLRAGMAKRAKLLSLLSCVRTGELQVTVPLPPVALSTRVCACAAGGLPVPVQGHL